jgi:hypothetical protein
MSPSPSPSPAPPADPAHAALSGVLHGLAQAATQNPWLLAAVGICVLIAVVRGARVAVHSGPLDPTRLFSGTDKKALLERAGHRCEHYGWSTGRCSVVEHLEADHVHPHSRGGWTHISNGQILCRPHNRAKRAAIPWNRSLRKLAERRGDYFPAEADPVVVRRRPRATADGS